VAVVAHAHHAPEDLDGIVAARDLELEGDGRSESRWVVRLDECLVDVRANSGKPSTVL
jgi:hypothetical protein